MYHSAGRLHVVIDSSGLRKCPRCAVALSGIDLRLYGTFVIGYCDQCRGVFFDRSQLRELILSPNLQAESPQTGKLAELLTKEQEPVAWEEVFLKCPTCQTLMNREQLGGPSGIFANICSAHGFWVDDGELSALLHWARLKRPETVAESLSESGLTEKVQTFDEAQEDEVFTRQAELHLSRQVEEVSDEMLLSEALAGLFADWV